MTIEGKTLIHLGIGEMVISSSEDEYVFTVLGSCVSVCLFSEEFKVGGVIHCLLPDKGYSSAIESDLYFVKQAVPLLINKLMDDFKGLRPYHLKAKIAGGGTVLGNNVAEINISTVKNVLKEHGILIVGEHTGGRLSRKIRFFPTTGQLLVLAI